MSLRRTIFTALLTLSTLSSAFSITKVLVSPDLWSSTGVVASIGGDELSNWSIIEKNIGGLTGDDLSIDVCDSSKTCKTITVSDIHTPCAYDGDPSLTWVGEALYDENASSWYIQLRQDGQVVGEVCAPIATDLFAHVTLTLDGGSLFEAVEGKNPDITATLGVSGVSSESVSYSWTP